jgi:hypothetical protein
VAELARGLKDLTAEQRAELNQQLVRSLSDLAGARI